MASIPACAMCSGVAKSGSPAASPIMSWPSALRRAARAVTASVDDGLTRWTRRERDKVTGFPAVRQKSGGAAILRDRAGPHQSRLARATPQPFEWILHGTDPVQPGSRLRALGQ